MSSIENRIPSAAKTFTVRDLLLMSADFLTRHGVPHARREAEWLLADLLDCTRLGVYLHFAEDLPEMKRTQLREWVRRRARREPRAYITGRAEFMGRRFIITPDVLIPRPETEVLAAVGLEKFPREAAIRIADVGTGSGVLAATLLAGYPNAAVVATDISLEAIKVARQNLSNLGLDTRATFCVCDLLPTDAAPFNLIVANLPYVSEGEYEKVAPEVKAEPKAALVPGPKGTELIERLIKTAPQFLGGEASSARSGGWLLLEIGYNQSPEVERMLSEAGFSDVFVEEDLAGIPRVAGGRAAHSRGMA